MKTQCWYLSSSAYLKYHDFLTSSSKLSNLTSIFSWWYTLSPCHVLGSSNFVMIVLSYLTYFQYAFDNFSAVSLSIFNLTVLRECDRQMQLKMQHEKRKDDARWKLLARKVASARVISSLSLPKRKRDEEIKVTIDNSGIRSFELHWVL